MAIVQRHHFRAIYIPISLSVMVANGLSKPVPIIYFFCMMCKP